MRTKEEQIKYFEWLAEEYATDAAREEDKMKAAIYAAQADAYQTAARELIPPSAFKVIDHEKDARNLAKNLERRLALRSEKLTIDEKIALWKGL